MILNGEDVNRDAAKGENMKCEENKSLTYGRLVSKQSPVANVAIMGSTS